MPSSGGQSTLCKEKLAGRQLFYDLQEMAETRIVARSVSRQVCEWLGRGLQAARVLAAFDRVCNLVTGGGDVIALVAPQIGDGPLNVVLGGADGLFGRAQVGKEVLCDRDRLLVYDGARAHCFQVDLREAATWEPCPGWAGLRAQRGQMRSPVDALWALCSVHKPRSALEPLLGAMHPADDSHLEAQPGWDGLNGIVLDRAAEAAADLCAGWGGNGERLRRGGEALAGLGQGLTPAGDDYMGGAMLAAWLAHPEPSWFCQTLAQAAAPRTTTLSAAFLRAAARGQCSADWHRLLGALVEGAEADVVAAGRHVSGFGATSGVDALIGFLHLSCCARSEGQDDRWAGCFRGGMTPPLQ
jgi:hypothetical protein